MKILIVGLGSIGRRHFRNLRFLGQSDLLLYRTGKATLPDDELAGVPVENDLQAALDHRPDAVVVSNPTALHLDVAIPAAKAGCAILLEKPISHNLTGVDALRRASASSGANILVGFQFRFHPGLQAAKAAIADGTIGRPISARAHWGEYLPNWHPWEDYKKGYAARQDLGGGVVLTLCHPIDYLRMLLGEVETASGVTSNLGLGLPVEDTAEITLQFASGVISSVHLDYVQQPPAHWLEVIGTEGTLRWENATGAVSVSRPGHEAASIFTPPTGFERNHLFLDEMKHFIAVTTGSDTPLCTLNDGVRALEICLDVLHHSRRPA